MAFSSSLYCCRSGVSLALLICVALLVFKKVLGRLKARITATKRMVWRCQDLMGENGEAVKVSGLLGRTLMTSLLVMTDIAEDSVGGTRKQPKPHFGCNITGPNAFESLNYDDKWRVLAYVARYLFTDAGPAPELTALSESTVYYIFMTLYLALEGSPELYGADVLAVYREKCDEDYELDEDDVEDVDPQEWSNIVMDHLAQLVLWDEDFLGEEIKQLARVPGGNNALRVEPDNFTDTAVLDKARRRFATPAEARAYIFRLASDMGVE